MNGTKEILDQLNEISGFNVDPKYFWSMIENIETGQHMQVSTKIIFNYSQRMEETYHLFVGNQESFVLIFNTLIKYSSSQDEADVKIFIKLQEAFKGVIYYTITQLENVIDNSIK